MGDLPRGDITILETCDSPPPALTCKNPELDNNDLEYQSITPDPLDQNNASDAKIDSPRGDATRTAPDDLPGGVVSTPNADNKTDPATAPSDAPAQSPVNNDPEHDNLQSLVLDLGQDLTSNVHRNADSLSGGHTPPSAALTTTRSRSRPAHRGRRNQQRQSHSTRVANRVYMYPTRRPARR